MLKYFIFSENMIWYFMQIVSDGDNLHEMSNHVFFRKYLKMSSAEIITQSANR